MIKKTLSTYLRVICEEPGTTVLAALFVYFFIKKYLN